MGSACGGNLYYFNPVLSGCQDIKFICKSLQGVAVGEALDNHTPWGYHIDMNTQLKNKLLKRLKIIAGQVRGLQGMLEADAYCVDIITQASAVKKAVSSFEDAVLKNHLSTHVVEQIKSGQHAKAVSEVMKVYSLSKKDN